MFLLLSELFTVIFFTLFRVRLDWQALRGSEGSQAMWYVLKNSCFWHPKCKIHCRKCAVFSNLNRCMPFILLIISYCNCNLQNHLFLSVYLFICLCKCRHVVYVFFQGIPGSIGPPGIAGQRGEKVWKLTFEIN